MRPCTNGILKSVGSALHGDFKHPNACWRDNPGGHKQSRRFLECSDDSFLTQVIKESLRRGALLDLILTHNKGLVGKVKVKGSFCCSNHKPMNFRILREGVRVKCEITTLDFRRAHWPLSETWLEESREINSWRKKGPKKHFFFFIYSRITYSMLKRHPSQQIESQAKMPGGLCG